MKAYLFITPYGWFCGSWSKIKYIQDHHFQKMLYMMHNTNSYDYICALFVIFVSNMLQILQETICSSTQKWSKSVSSWSSCNNWSKNHIQPYLCLIVFCQCLHWITIYKVITLMSYSNCLKIVQYLKRWAWNSYINVTFQPRIILTIIQFIALYRYIAIYKP